jgi:BRCT domain type II-containing protein
VLPKLALEPLIKEEPSLPIVLVFGGELDWVDRTGAKRLADKYPSRVKIV